MIFISLAILLAAGLGYMIGYAVGLMRGHCCDREGCNRDDD